MHIKSILPELGKGRTPAPPLLARALDALERLDKNAGEYDPNLAFKTAEKNGFDTESLRLIFNRFRSMRQHLLKGANARPFRYPFHYFVLQFKAFMLLIDMKELFANLYVYSGDQTLLQEIEDAEFAKADPEYVFMLGARRRAFLEVETRLDAEDTLITDF